MLLRQKPSVGVVISGGASHGADLFGAALVTLGRVKPLRYSGASIGAVIAAGLALGLTPAFIQERLCRLFQKNALTGGRPPIGVRARIVWARGGGLNDWGDVVAALKSIFGNAKMGEVKTPLAIAVADAYTRRTVYIRSDTHPDVLIWEALAASTACWPVADAQTIPSLGRGNRLYIDGGWGDNCPTLAWGFTDTPNVVIYLAQPDRDSDGEPDVIRVEGVAQILGAALELALSSDPKCRDQDIPVPIQTFGSGFDFDLKSEEIQRRIKNGVEQARKVFRSRGIL